MKRWMLLLVAVALLGCGKDTTPSKSMWDVGIADIIFVNEKTDILHHDADGKGPDGGHTGENKHPQEGPVCLVADPQTLDFHHVAIGNSKTLSFDLIPCTLADVEIYDIRMGEGTPGNFVVFLANLPHVPSADNPLHIPYDETLLVEVNFTASEGGEFEAIVVVESSSADTPLLVPISAEVNIPQPECPTAIIHCAEDDEVDSGTVLHFKGKESYANSGSIQEWEWSVEQPEGAQSMFAPSNTDPNPVFKVETPGVYNFCLDVVDNKGVKSCFPAKYDVLVVGPPAIWVELTWVTPGDPDETDKAGSDLNLHFQHPLAKSGGLDLDEDGEPDGWFNVPYDCFFYNFCPNWGSYDPEINDDPHLDTDDTDGAGPENITLEIPEAVTYRVGVYYWNDHEFGPALATVRVFLLGELAYEAEGLELKKLDMWEVCTIEWPSGAVKPVTNEDGLPKVTPDYVNPYFGP